jgi:hypothetical protein
LWHQGKPRRRRRRDPPDISGDTSRPRAVRLYRLHQELIGVRRRHAWLHRAQSRVIEIRNTDLLFEAFDQGNQLWGALNIADSHVTRTVGAKADKLAGNVAVTQEGGSTEIGLPPHGWGILA